jgi:uncharacterized RDD family membrane protein YckC
MSDFLPPPPPGYGAPQFSPVGFELAGWWSRLGAIILDGLILIIPGFVLTAVFGDAAGYLLQILLGLAYSVYFIGTSGQTLGKKATGVKVIRDGSPAPIGYGLATGRCFAAILSGLLCLLGYFWPLWDSKNQTFHDKICSTVVIKA